MHTLTLNFETITEIQELMAIFAQTKNVSANDDSLTIENAKLSKTISDLTEENKNLKDIVNQRIEEPDLTQIKNDGILQGRGQCIEVLEQSFEMHKLPSWPILKELIFDSNLYNVEQVVELKRKKMAELATKSEVK